MKNLILLALFLSGTVAPVLESAAAFQTLASESLCQSWGGQVRIFPSVPKGFTGSFRRFRTREGHVVSASMKNGKVVDFELLGAKQGEKITVTCPADPDFVQLPGEPAWKKPVGCGPFPDALSALVFRNWTLVPASTIAGTVGATEEDIRRIAAEMGLDPSAEVPREWRRSGYVTILRRNWQILPYGQLLDMTGMSRRELRHALMHDDSLFGKLGKTKPDARRIVFSSALAAAGREARIALRKTLEKEGVAIADVGEEPRFAFMKNLSVVPDDMKNGAPPRPQDARFGRRMVFPYCADYGDVLDDPEAASCSEGLISRLAQCGVDTLWFHVVLSSLSTDPKYPEWGKDAPRRRAALAKLVERAAKYGVKVFLYINEPRVQPDEFFRRPGRAGMRGAADRRGAGYYALCTEDPATLGWLEECLKGLFSEIPGLGGVFTVTMSETTTHCASQFSGPQASCAACRGRPYEYFVKKVNEAIVRGVKGGNPEAAVWFFDVGWELEGLDRRVIPLLPKEGSLLLWSEKFLPFRQAGRMHKVTEYSISHPGPAERALGFWKMAKDAGLGTVAKLQVSCSWEISAVPYLPAMDLVAKHAFNLANSPVDDVMLSWSLGGYPSRNLAVFNDFRTGDTEDSLLNRAARFHYGESAAPYVRRAWTAYSKAFAEYPIEWQTVYYSPVQMGPANLLYARKTGWSATMVNTPYDDFANWSAGYADNRNGWIEQMRKVAAGFENADRLWKEAVGKMSGAAAAAGRRDAVVFRAATLHFRTCVDQAEFILSRDRGDREAMRRSALCELATAKEMLSLVRSDSRLGYEASNRYIYVPNDFMEKILNCREVLAEKED